MTQKTSSAISTTTCGSPCSSSYITPSRRPCASSLLHRIANGEATALWDAILGILLIAAYLSSDTLLSPSPPPSFFLLVPGQDRHGDRVDAMLFSLFFSSVFFPLYTTLSHCHWHTKNDQEVPLLLSLTFLLSLLLLYQQLDTGKLASPFFPPSIVSSPFIP